MQKIAETPFMVSIREKIEKEIAQSISFLGAKTPLRDACEYALTNGGKRYRPMIVFLVADALGKGLCVRHAALSVEFFHTASLIADDLPCMDNDSQRRDKPTLHRVYGETIALLASYALITAGFESIYRNTVTLQKAPLPFSAKADQVCTLALENVARSSGILGATGGQFLDLFPPSPSVEAVKQVIYQKTITLFEVSFVLGWLFGGGDVDKLEQVKKIAYHFGMAFQITDDLGDLQQDEQKQRAINMARVLGKKQAFALVQEDLLLCKKEMEKLHLFSASFERLSNQLGQLAAHNLQRG